MAAAAVTTTVLPLQVAMKTLAAIAMVGAQTTNNQLKTVMVTVAETVTMTATTITIQTKGTSKAAEERQKRGGGGQLGGGGGSQLGDRGGSLSSARRWRHQPAWRRRRQLGESEIMVIAA